MASEEVALLLEKHGYTGKFVRAYCASRGWRYTPNGAPMEWYQAFQQGLVGL